MFGKIMTIVFSIIVFKHEINWIQIVSLVIVFRGLFYEFKLSLGLKKKS